MRKIYHTKKVSDGFQSYSRLQVLTTFCSQSADGLRSLEDVRDITLSAMRDLAFDRRLFQVIQLQISLEQALGAVLSLRNEFSPINRLPTESLMNIFDIVCTQDQGDTRARAHHATTLAQVCSHWRSDVISTPLLWSTIHISRKTRPQFISLCLERSGDVPLEITLEMRGGLLAFPGLPTYPRSNPSLFVSDFD